MVEDLIKVMLVATLIRMTLLEMMMEVMVTVMDGDTEEDPQEVEVAPEAW
jgi:hypothetical protein